MQYVRLQVLAYRQEETMKGMDQEGLRFQEECTLRLPGTSTQCRDCFSTIAAFQVTAAFFNICITLHGHLRAKRALNLQWVSITHA